MRGMVTALKVCFLQRGDVSSDDEDFTEVRL